MPRPPTSSLARRPHPSAPTLPSSSATSSAAPTLRRAPSSGQAYSTAATPATAGAGSPTLDFLYPGFGFFSRALPSAANGGTGPSSHCELVAWSLANGSFAGPPPPPPQPAPSPAPSSPSPPPPRTTFFSPPPPSPQPHREPLDVRSWRSSEGMSALSGRRTLLAGGAGAGAGTAMGRCSCGRVRQGCLRCRGASTSAAGVRRREVVHEKEEEEGRTAGGRDEKGKGREVEDSRIRRVGNEEGGTTVEADSVPSDSSETPTPSDRLSRLLSTHAPRNLPSVRGSSISSSPRRNRRPSRSRALAPTADDVESSLAALWEAAQHEAFVQALSEREKLDLVRGFTQLVRALPSPPAAQTKPDPIDPAASPSIAAQAERRLSLRNLASSHALSLLSSTRLWPCSAEPSALPPSSSIHASAALHYLDALALSSSGPRILAEALLPPPIPDFVPHPMAEAARSAVDRLFHSSSPSHDPSSTVEQREKRAANLLKHQKTALALLLEAFEHSPPSGSSMTDGAEALLHLVSSSPSALSLLDPSSATTVQELGYTHVLRRRYGVLLSTLYPSPSRWIADQEYVRREPLGLHLVRFLAPAGNALEAQEVWRVVEAERMRRMEEEQGRGEVPNADALAEEERKRLAALTVLVEGLTMERYFGDANALARELEGLALTVQEEGVASPLSSPNEKDVELVASAFRVLAKLASDQGRMPILDRLLERLSAISSTTSSSSSTPSPSSPSSLTLESAARRLRSSSHRYDISSVQSIFDTASSAAEFITAPPAEKARLWSQLVLAYARVNDVEKAVETVQIMAGKEGLQVPLSAVNAILYGFARRGDLKTTFELFSQVVEGVFPLVQPDLGSWNALVLACEMARDPTAAEGVVQEMKAVGFEPNLKTWTTLMNAYVENGQWSAAFAVFRFLNSQPRHSSLRPDTAAANVMLKACVLTAVPAEQVLQLFRGLVEHGLRPNMQTYTHVMQSVCHAGLMDVAEELFLMLDAADRPRSRSPASATSPPASSVVSSLPLPTPMGVVRPDQFIFANLIGGFLYSGQPAKARAFLAEMRSRGMAPTTTTMVIVLGARLRAHHHRLQDYSVYGVRSVLQQTRAFLEDDSLPVRKKQQPVKVDRSLAHGKEAVALLAPVIRALGKAKDKDGAVEVFEEALQLTKSARDGGVEGPVAVELYTSFMDALRRDENPADAARNVRVVWERVYDLVSQRYVRLRPDPSASATSTQRKRRLVDPAQASILAVPLTILIETLNRAGSDLEIESTWRRLADQGFVFDASNWNVLARYFARDLQLERAMWIVNNVLTVPSTGVFPPSPSSSPSSSPPSTASPASSDLDDFLRAFSSSPRTEAIGRVPLRVRSFRHAELDRQRKQPLDIASIFSGSPSPPSPAPSADSPSSGEAITATFAESYAARAATVWHPFGATLETLDGALETLTASGSARSVQLYKKAMKKQRAWQRKRQQQQAGEVGYEQVVEEMLTGQVGQDDLFVEPSEEFRAQLLRKYPRAAMAIEQWKTRYERWAREREHFLAWVKRTGGAGVGGAGDGGFA